MTTVLYLRPAQSALRKYRNVAGKIMGKIDEVAANPEAHANNVTRLQGRPESRLRVGDFRVIFVQEADELIIIDIAPRGGVYD